jgi:hypothetical protein
MVVCWFLQKLLSKIVPRRILLEDGGPGPIKQQQQHLAFKQVG